MTRLKIFLNTFKYSEYPLYENLKIHYHRKIYNFHYENQYEKYKNILNVLVNNYRH